MTRRTLALVVVVLVAGCSGAFAPDQPTETQEQRLRLVVQNDASSPRTVGLTLTAEGGRTVFDETKTLQPGGGWVVSTFDVSALTTPVSVTARLPERNYTDELTPIRGTDRGSRLYTVTDDGITLYECSTNVTCWQGKPAAL